MNELFDFVRIEDGPGPNSFTASLYWDKDKREYFTRSGSLEHDRILALGTLWRKYGGSIMRHILESNEPQNQKPSMDCDSSAAMELIDWRLGAVKETARVLQGQLDGLLRQPEQGKDMQFWLQKFSKKNE